MKIEMMRVNHICAPLGYELGTQTFSWRYAEAEFSDPLAACRLVVSDKEDYSNILYETPEGLKEDHVAVSLALPVKPCCRYYWKVCAVTESGETTENRSWFETGRMDSPWKGVWIRPEAGETLPIVRKAFSLQKEIKSARLYCIGLGLYEAYINGKLVNDGYLQPGFMNFNFWTQHHSFDVTDVLEQGKNVLAFYLGNGWYKGRFGVNGGFENNFGSHFQILCDLSVTYTDGTVEVVGSDKSFLQADGPIVSGSIYDGEVFDAGREPEGWMLPDYDASSWKEVTEAGPENLEKITERYSIPIRKMDTIKPEGIRDKEGNLVLNTKQNLSGWVVFRDKLKAGETIRLRYCELFEDGKVSSANLDTAKQEFVYTSDGKGRLVRPHFTYFGFQYVEVTGDCASMTADDFEVWDIYSAQPAIGSLETGNSDVNRLIANTVWSQRSNFVEHPTDCPQRSERLGWTGDAQIYSSAACFHMDTLPFFRKYIKDVNEEQAHKNGMVPFIVPKIAGRGFEDAKQDECSAAWSDVSTVVPWDLYLHYGDKNVLAEEYAGMKAWVGYMVRQDEASGNKHLWQSGFHFGDWLAMDGEMQDGPKPGMKMRDPFGATDNFYISSAFYYYSSKLTGKAAAVLGYEEDADYYAALSEKIRQALLEEYFEDGISRVDTQTAYAMAVYMGIAPEDKYRANGDRLVEKIKANGGRLDTGFVGTPYLCHALSMSGHTKEAYELLLQEECPGWLYEVKTGATTVWESWDCLNPDGTFAGHGSLNHYAFGSVVDWIYRCVCGFNLSEGQPGGRELILAPQPDKSIGWAKGILDMDAGRYELKWEYDEAGKLAVEIKVPYEAEAVFILPDSGEQKRLKAGDYRFEV